MLSRAFVLVSFATLCLNPENYVVAQVFQVGGGTSSLYQSGGGSITVRGISNNLTLGAGTFAGHVLEGAQLVKATSNAKYIVGDDRIDFHLPTDIFASSYFLLARGLGISTTRHQIDILAFAGATATEFSSPVFEGAKTDTAAGILFLKKQLSPHFQVFSNMVVSRKMTEIGAIAWQPRPGLDLAFSAGMGANQPYSAVSFKISRPHIDMQAAYIEAGQQFHRIVLISPLLAEPDRENVQVTVRPFSFITFSGGRQNYLVQQAASTTNVRSVIENVASSFCVFRTSLNGTFYHSDYEGAQNHAVAFSANRDFTSRVHGTASYLVSHPRNSPGSRSFISTVTEALTSRISVNESVTNANGHTSLNFGGEILTNFVTVGANYDTYYVPANNSTPFQQELVLDIKANVFGRLMLHAESFVDPEGHIRYTADANTIMYRGAALGKVTEHAAIGKYVLQGCVVDDEGNAIEGAALRVDKRTIFTDSTGCFLMRESKSRSHKLEVVLSEFLENGDWQLIYSPSTINSTAEQDRELAKVIVEVRRARVKKAPA